MLHYLSSFKFVLLYFVSGVIFLLEPIPAVLGLMVQLNSEPSATALTTVPPIYIILFMQ